MFLSLFPSQNKKLVKKWEKEHEQIVVIAHEVIAEYSKNDYEATKKALKKLNSLAVDHLMHEDIEFFRLLRDQKRLNGETEVLVREFTHTFKDTKVTLMKFLSKYTQVDTPIDEEFFEIFNELVGVLAERISFEEDNLYALLKSN